MITTWQEALDWLYGLANWETRPPGTALTFELDRVRGLLSDLGDPHHAWPAVHVGGTNGKGSTCAMVASGLRAAGLRVGLFTSPHLHTVRERIVVDGAPIPEASVIAWLNANRDTCERRPGLTTFEALTALAFDTFAHDGVDVGVVEVGLGGTFDTTNVVCPVVSALTTIGLDHTDVLGRDLATIAGDKVGILRPGVPVVSAAQHPSAAAVIEARARDVGSPLTVVGTDVTVTGRRPIPDGQALRVSVGAGRSYAVRTPLMGAHQAGNVAVAVAVLDRLAAIGWPVDERAVVDGLAAVAWPARFERLAASPAFIVDGAHNPDGVGALLVTLAERYPGRRRHLVVGVSRGKDAEGILAPLVRSAARVVVTQSEHPRALPAEDVARLVSRHGAAAVVRPSPAAALAHALDGAGPDDVVVATGSIFVAADIREAWAARGGMPMPPRDPPPVTSP